MQPRPNNRAPESDDFRHPKTAARPIAKIAKRNARESGKTPDKLPHI
jgi:hypothetical protein